MTTSVLLEKSAQTAARLTQATVLASLMGCADVRLDGGEERQAVLAFTFPYVPQAGDRLLVVTQGSEAFAIGVLAGQAQSKLTFSGDVEVRALDGRLHLRGDEGVTLESPQLTIRAQLLRRFAGTVNERVDTAYRWVRELLTVRAGESRRVVEGEDHSRSQRSVTLAEGTVRIDGDQVHLGH
jgi:hypothetical protein